MGRRLRCQDHWRGHWNMHGTAFLFWRPSWKMVEETMFSMFSSAYPVYSYTGLRQFSAWTHSWLSWDLGGYWNNVWNTKLRSIAVLVYLFHICPPCPWVVLELFADQSSMLPELDSMRTWTQSFYASGIGHYFILFHYYLSQGPSSDFQPLTYRILQISQQDSAARDARVGCKKNWIRTGK